MPLNLPTSLWPLPCNFCDSVTSSFFKCACRSVGPRNNQRTFRRACCQSRRSILSQSPSDVKTSAKMRYSIVVRVLRVSTRQCVARTHRARKTVGLLTMDTPDQTLFCPRFGPQTAQTNQHTVCRLTLGVPLIMLHHVVMIFKSNRIVLWNLLNMWSECFPANLVNLVKKNCYNSTNI